MKTNKTSTKTDWGSVADWYDGVVEGDNSYQKNVIEPNLLRMLGDIKNKKVLDIACGQGYFSNLMSLSGAEVTGFDLGADLIKIAKEKNKKVNFQVLNAENFAENIKDKFDIAVCVLALQNIENAKKVLENAKKILNTNGIFIIILNHPAFRIPKVSSWHNDNDIQYRRVDAYMSESKIKIDMNPGSNSNKEYTYSYHRPLQYYFKLFSNTGFAVTRLEEWISHKESQDGPRKAAEDKARHEFPMFMCIELTAQ
jgi:SAM-dependent methyltransferase